MSVALETIPDLKLLRVVLSCVNKQTRLTMEILGWVEATVQQAGLCGEFKNRISHSVAVPETRQTGRRIFQTEPALEVPAECWKLAREMLDRLESAAIEQRTAGSQVGAKTGRAHV